MEKATRICKVCGKEYEYCHTIRDTGMFRWQDVACCQEHGEEYFRQVLEARRIAEEEAGLRPKLVKVDPEEDDEVPFDPDDDDYEDELDDDEDGEEDEF